MKQNILVIGGGIIGLSTAFAAAKAGFTVTLLEADPDYPPCSWVAGGILSALLPWQYRPAVHALIERSQAAYQDWVQELVALGGLNPEYRADGLLILPAFDSQQVSKWQRANRSVVNNVAPTEIAAGVAALGEALWLPHVAHIRSNRLLTAARQAAVNLGVRIESKVVLSLKKNAQRVLGAVTPTGDVLSDVTIIAAGAWTPNLLSKKDGAGLNIQPMRGQMLLFAAPAQPRPIIYQNGFYLITRADGSVLAGSTVEDVGYALQTTEEAAQTLYAKAIALLPELKAAVVTHHWAGLRPGSPDNIPTIAPHPLLENLYINSGHFRYGITMAPASAEIIVNYMREHPQVIDVTPYSYGIRQSPNCHIE